MHVRFKRWDIEIDTERTRDGYAVLADAQQDSCSCNTCRNFRALGSEAFPQELRQFAEGVGIDLRLPSEVYHNARLPSGLHSYGGWYHVVGTLQAGRSGWRATSPTSAAADFEPLGPHFRVGLSTKDDLVPAPFRLESVVQLDIDAELPWVLPEPEAG